MSAAQLSVQAAYAKENRRNPIDRLFDRIEALSLRNLESRARRVFGRHYDADSFDVSSDRIPNSFGLRTHVQITLQGYPLTLVLFTTNGESYPGKLITRHHLMMGYCHNCGKEFSTHWVPPFGRAFLEGVGTIISSTDRHTCTG
jgi:hypothetical protein